MRKDLHGSDRPTFGLPGSGTRRKVDISDAESLVPPNAEAGEEVLVNLEMAGDRGDLQRPVSLRLWTDSCSSDRGSVVDRNHKSMI